MKINNKYFPYPVIKEDTEDYNKTTYKTEVLYKEDNDDIILNINFLLDNIEINNLINEKKAEFVLHLEESLTMYREAFIFNESQVTVRVSKDRVRHKVELSSFIVSKDNLKNFKSDDLNIIYSDISINYSKFNIIGVGQSSEIIIEKEADEIKDVASIFQIVKSDEKKLIKIRLANERIYIDMPSEDYERYNQLTHRYRYLGKNNNHLILLSLVIIPSFVEALTIIKSDYKEYEDNLWYKPLVKAFSNKNVNIEEKFLESDFSAYELTQVIFDSVLNESIKRLDEVEKE